MAYEQEDREEQKRRFEKLEESIHKAYRLVLTIGVGVLAGCALHSHLVLL